MINWIKNFFNKALKIFKAFINTVFTELKKVIIAELKDVALVAVTELKDADLNNEEKRKQAFRRIEEYAITNGIQIRTHIINLLIEMAYSAIKNMEEDNGTP